MFGNILLAIGVGIIVIGIGNLIMSNKRSNRKQQNNQREEIKYTKQQGKGGNQRTSYSTTNAKSSRESDNYLSMPVNPLYMDNSNNSPSDNCSHETSSYSNTSYESSSSSYSSSGSSDYGGSSGGDSGGCD